MNKKTKFFLLKSFFVVSSRGIVVFESYAYPFEYFWHFCIFKNLAWFIVL